MKTLITVGRSLFSTSYLETWAKALQPKILKLLILILTHNNINIIVLLWIGHSQTFMSNVCSYIDDFHWKMVINSFDNNFFIFFLL